MDCIKVLDAPIAVLSPVKCVNMELIKKIRPGGPRFHGDITRQFRLFEPTVALCHSLSSLHPKPRRCKEMNVSRMKVHSLFMVFFVVLLTAVSACSQSATDEMERSVTVMTRNLYLGADLTPVLLAIVTGTQDLEVAVAQVYEQAISSQIPIRAQVIAGEIAAAQPHLVGLQEAVVWTASDDTIDFLELIMEELEAAGQQYEIVTITPGFDAEFGPFGLSVQNAILARTDLPPSDFSLSNIKTGQYEARVAFPPLLEIPRQWASVDVALRGNSFRFITTHLEAIGPPLYDNVRFDQAAELLDGPAVTPLPVIAVGDFNAEPDAEEDSAWLLIQNGFTDSWLAANPGQLGFTCCHPQDLSGDGASLDKQIDLVLFRGDFQVVTAEIVGEKIGDKTASGLWPSDHAGLVATLLVPEGKD